LSFRQRDLPDWFREKVKRRDGYACVRCGYLGDDGKGKGLHVDHIEPESMIGESILDVDLYRTLCNKCHGKIGMRQRRDVYGAAFDIEEGDPIEAEFQHAFEGLE